MRVRLSASIVLLCSLAASCAPKEKCSGTLYYDPVNESCRECPKTATFKGGTCRCKSGYAFKNDRCELKDSSGLETPDSSTSSMDDSGGPNLPDSSMPSGPSCAEYCDFAKLCIGDNTLAAGALPDIVAGLHAKDTSACASACQSDLGGSGANNPVVTCIDSGRDAAMCAGDSSQTALAGAIGLVADCCRTNQADALCKSICKTLKANALIAGMVDFCQ
jgi:hypothetical protein